MSIAIARATPLHLGSVKDGGHVRFRYFATVISPTLSPILVRRISNASLIAAAPRGDLNRIIRARDLGIGPLAAGALTLARAREIICTDVDGVAAGSESVLTNRNVPRARLSHNVRGPSSDGTANGPTSDLSPARLMTGVDVDVDVSGRIVLAIRCWATPKIGTVEVLGENLVGYVDLLFQHSLFRT